MSHPAPLRPALGALLVRRSLSVIVSIVAIAVGVLAGAAGFLGGLFVSLPAAIGVGALATVAVTWILTAVAHRMWRSPRTGVRKSVLRRRSPFIVAGGVLALVSVLAGTTILAPTADASPQSEGVPPAKYWDLSTGSRIGYWKSEGSGAKESSTPIVFVHGGPGGFANDVTIQFFSAMADSGRDVYVYDQAGAGQSANLATEEYTTERWVADLDAIRGEIGAEVVDLVGHSAGGYVVEAYTAAHPDHVGHVALISPGGYDSSPERLEAVAEEQEAVAEKQAASADEDQAASADEESDAGPSPSERSIAALMLRQTFGSVPAENLLSQDQMKSEMNAIGGVPLNVYANQTLTEDFTRTTPGTLQRLSELEVPTLLIRAENDYISWAEQEPYLLANADVTTVYVEDASHGTWAEQPKTVRAALEAFFADEPQPAGVYEGTENPVLAGARGATD